jgi:hypothetical protein
MVSRITPVAPVSHVPRVMLGSSLVKEELYTLYYTNRIKYEFHAKSVDAAIRIARRKLGLPMDASAERFRAAGGDYILRNSTGNRVYPFVSH